MTTPQTPGRTMPPLLEKEGGPSAVESSDLKVGPPRPAFTHGFLDALWSFPAGASKEPQACGTPERGRVFPWGLWSECVSSLRQSSGSPGLDPRTGLYSPPSEMAPRAGGIPFLAAGQDYPSF